jgi:hypothetical protein
MSELVRWLGDGWLQSEVDFQGFAQVIVRFGGWFIFF